MVRASDGGQADQDTGRQADWESSFVHQEQVPYYQRFRNRAEPLVEQADVVSRVVAPVDEEDLVAEFGDEGETWQKVKNPIVEQEFTFEDPVIENDEMKTAPINEASIVDVAGVDVVSLDAGSAGSNEVLEEAELLLEEVIVEAQGSELPEVLTETPPGVHGEASTSVNTVVAVQQNVVPAVPDIDGVQSLDPSTSTPSPPRPGTPAILPLPPSRPTSPTVSPQVPEGQGYASIIQQTKDGLDPLDHRLQHPQQVPSTYDGVDSLMQTTLPPPAVPHYPWHIRPNIPPANAHIRRAPPIFQAQAPLLVHKPHPRKPESFLGPDPAHPRGPQPWSRWVQRHPSAGHHHSTTHHPGNRHHSNAWAPFSRRRNQIYA